MHVYIHTYIDAYLYINSQITTHIHVQVQYQSEERIRDIQDQLASLETKISRMEHQQAQHHQLAALEVNTTTTTQILKYSIPISL